MGVVSLPRSAFPQRVAMLSVHTSPLDQPGGGDAGGLNVYVVETSTRIAAAGIPVDAYGVGSSLIRGENDFTADVVMVEGKPRAKVGREYLANARMELVR